MDTKVYSQFYEMEEKNWWFRGTRMFLLDWIHRYVKQSKPKILDVGCGTGIWLSELVQIGDASGLDISEEAYNFCTARGLSIKIGSIEKMPFTDSSFDLVTAIGVIEHIENDSGAIKEIVRVIKPGGKVILLTSAYKSLWSAHDDIVHHKRRYTKSEFDFLLSNNGLKVKSISYLTSVLFPAIWPIRVLQRLFGWNPDPDKVTDIMKVPSIINQFLYSILRFESYFARLIPLPAGVNIVAIAEKKKD